MADKRVNLIISLKDGVSSGLSKIRSGFASVGEAAQKLYFTSKVVAAGIKTAFSAIAGPIQKAFDFETAKVQLKSLLGSVSEASQRFEELKKFSAETPFQLPDILKASRLLTVFSEGALGGAESLRSIGDAAAVSGQNISDVSFWVGRAYSMLKGGQPFGEAAMRLQEMGILTSAGRQEMEELQKSGAKFSVVWNRLNKDLNRSSGGMAELSQTGNGLVSTLKDNWTIAVATFGDTFLDLSKNVLSSAIDSIKRFTEDGSIERWASNTKIFIQDVITATKALKPAFDVLLGAGKKIAAGVRASGAYAGGFAGTLASGGNIKEAFSFAGESAKNAQFEFEARKAKSLELIELEKKKKLEVVESVAALEKQMIQSSPESEVKKTQGGFAELYKKMSATGASDYEKEQFTRFVAGQENVGARQGVSGAGKYAADLRSSGLSEYEVVQKVQDFIKAEIRGMTAGVQGVGAFAAELARGGASSYDVDQAVSSMLSNEGIGKAISGGLSDPLTKLIKSSALTQESITDLLALSKDRLGGVLN